MRSPLNSLAYKHRKKPVPRWMVNECTGPVHFARKFACMNPLIATLSFGYSLVIVCIKMKPTHFYYVDEASRRSCATCFWLTQLPGTWTSYGDESPAVWNRHTPQEQIARGTLHVNCDATSLCRRGLHPNLLSKPEN